MVPAIDRTAVGSVRPPARASLTSWSSTSLTLPFALRAACPRSHSRLSAFSVIEMAFRIFIRYTICMLDDNRTDIRIKCPPMLRFACFLTAAGLLLVAVPAAQTVLRDGLELSVASNETQGARPRMKLGKVLVFETAAAGAAPASGSHLFQADRGGRKGQWLRVSPRETPSNGTAGTEYHLVAPEVVGALPDIDVLGIHYAKVRPDRREAFEKFVREKLHPAVGNLRPDLRLLYYKAVRGPEAGNYIAIFALTRESRDTYWPGGSDSDALRAAFKPVQPLAAELLTYLVDGSALTDEKFAARVYESREWADFVLVPARPQ